MSYVVRKKRMVKSGLQLRLIAAFLCMGALAALFQVILLNRALLRLSGEMGDQGEVLIAALPQTLVSNAILTFCILVPMMLVFGTLITHRVAGPIKRFEDYLTDVANDESYGPCEIRRSDEMQDLCARINEAVYHLTSKLGDVERGRPTPRVVRAEEDSAPAVSVLDSAA